MTELENSTYTTNEPTTLSIQSSYTSRGKSSYGRRHKNMSNQGPNNYPSRQERSWETYSYYHTFRHNELTCCKNHTKKSQNTWNKEEDQLKPSK